MDGNPVPLALPAAPKTLKSLPYTKLYKAPRCRPTTLSRGSSSTPPPPSWRAFYVLKAGSLASRVGNTRRCLATSRLLRGGTHEGTALKWGELEQQAEISGVRCPAAAVSSNPEPSISNFQLTASTSSSTASLQPLLGLGIPGGPLRPQSKGYAPGVTARQTKL